ncbi:geranylgeranyl reductase family protein [Wenyingzhuangia heitensis]|uniref:Geranylgeranyl reductase family protein n=1 Tax=Wenyingzhuangia heitensis TaxID=1487859 RepID=A0ABX0U7Z1_9FLAO|nr:NAD(P)/FAD-dependent oxidoreductase [Wenyingzhuangia heitensis]NIJ44937.1 geranylgeranyl reductase family protein [Wenyingzhuangia heitensis]
MSTFDVAVVGSGPSGASAAFHLAKAGLKTVILEKETLPRYKVCGGGFVYRGRKNMPFDISEVVDIEFNKVDIYMGDKFHFVTERENPIISLVMRDAFDNLMVKKSQELGVELIEDCKVTKVVNKKDVVELETTKGAISATYVIAADGVYSQMAKMAGWTNDTRTLIPALEYEVEVNDADFKRLSKEIRFDIDAIPAGYGWCFPKKNHLSIGVGVIIKDDKKIKEYCAEYIKFLGIEEIISIEKHGYQIPVTPRTDGYVKNNVFLIGDAAGFADPLTAEGISNAIYSGKLVAKAIAEAGDDKEKAAKTYTDIIESTIMPELLTSMKLAKLFYGSKLVRKAIMKKYGQRFSEVMTDIFMGEKLYPKDIMGKLKEKLKEKIISI